MTVQAVLRAAKFLPVPHQNENALQQHKGCWPQVQHTAAALLLTIKVSREHFLFSLKGIQDKHKGHFVRLLLSHKMEHGLAL